MKRKIDEKIEAVELRKKGYSLSEILAKVNVAKSSVSVWIRNVPLTNKARMRLLTKISSGQVIAAENKRRQTRAKSESYFLEALQELKNVNVDGFSARLFCSLLYWCEGGKNTSTGLRFTNSDPSLIKTFMRLFRTGFEIDESKLRVGVHLHEYHSTPKQITFWSKVTDIPESKFIRPFLKPNTGKRIKENYPGCATIYYYHNDTLRNLLETAKAFFNVMGA